MIYRILISIPQALNKCDSSFTIYASPNWLSPMTEDGMEVSDMYVTFENDVVHVYQYGLDRHHELNYLGRPVTSKGAHTVVEIVSGQMTLRNTVCKFSGLGGPRTHGQKIVTPQ